MRDYATAIRERSVISRMGEVCNLNGLLVESKGPDVVLGEVCDIAAANGSAIQAETVALKDGKVLLMPYGEVSGIALGNVITARGTLPNIPVSPALLGRVIDAFGNPLDEKGPLPLHRYWPLAARPISPLSRSRISDVLETKVRSIDTLLTIGKGQRMGIFSGSGVGKSTLLGMICRYVQADVNVIAMIGERGREVREFLEKSLGPAGLARSVVVVATSDQPAIMRVRAAHAATAIAEYFRDQGKQVVLTMDSVTRFAMAQREIGLAIGEPPTARGYTPSVFAALPRLLERCGMNGAGGSITAFYTVLVEGDDLNDPVADNLRALLDGHIVLTRPLANYGHFPAIDVLQSSSRLLTDVVTKPERELVRQVVSALAIYDKNQQMVDIGAYKAGTNLELDRAIQLVSEINKVLRQDVDQHTPRNESMQWLGTIIKAKSGATR
jgi:flagellum-specific ATP synthase